MPKKGFRPLNNGSKIFSVIMTLLKGCYDWQIAGFYKNGRPGNVKKNDLIPVRSPCKLKKQPLQSILSVLLL